MRSSSRMTGVRDTAFIVIPILLVLAAIAWGLKVFVGTAPPFTFILATASKGSPYDRFAELYRPIFAKNGVTLKVRQSEGSGDNFRLLTTPDTGVDAAFLQGGLHSAKDAPDLASVGRIAYEPLWVFYRGNARLERLTDLAGRRVLTGPAGSGTEALTRSLLAANGVTAANATLVSRELPDYVDMLAKGEADAGFLVLGADARTVQRLLRTPDVHLMSFTNADAYTQKFPYLSKLVLREGVVDLGQHIPPADTTLISTTAAVLVRKTAHTALIGLLAQAIAEVHGAPPVDQPAAASFFNRPGEFPTQTDPEFPMSDDARRVYRAGAPFLQRYLPFWIAATIDHLLVSLVLIVPLLIPLSRLGPQIYRWRIRQRLLRWYGVLKRLEARMGNDASPAARAAELAELDAIEHEVSGVPIPLGFADQYYQLRQSIDVVRNRLAGRPAASPSPPAWTPTAPGSGPAAPPPPSAPSASVAPPPRPPASGAAWT